MLTCQGTAITTHYSHKTTTTTRTIVLQQVSKQQGNGPSGLLSARNISVSTRNKHLAVPDRYTVKTQSRDMRYDETWKLETEPGQDIQVSKLSQDRDMKKPVSR